MLALVAYVQARLLVPSDLRTLLKTDFPERESLFSFYTAKQATLEKDLNILYNVAKGGISLTEKIKKRLNNHYYKYLHKEKYRNMLNDFLFFFLWKLTYKIFSLKKADKRLILFVANKDKELPDDYKDIYNYANSLGYKTVCLCKSYGYSTVFYKNELNKIIYDLKFTKYYAAAKCTFVSDYYLPAFANPPRKGSRLVQLWHGCGAFKKWGYSTKEGTWGLKSDFFTKYNVHQTYTDIITSSEQVNSIYAEAFNADVSKVKSLGVGRTDVFFNSDSVSKKAEEVYESFGIEKSKKTILWAPTYRGDSLQKSHNELTIDIEKLYKELSKNYVLIIKLHPHLAKKLNVTDTVPDYMKSFIINPKHNYPIDKLLCAADILISDYSSLVFEYALFEKPMIFYAYDLEEYESSRSFYYEYKNFVPGSIVTDTDGIINEIQNISNGYDKQKIIEFKNTFMSACDGNSAKRIFDEMIK